MPSPASHTTSQNSDLETKEISKITPCQPCPEDTRKRKAFVSQFLKANFAPLAKSNRSYIDTGALEHMAIKCLHVDFNTGRLSNGVAQFIDPIPPSKIEDDGDDEDNPLENLGPASPQWEAASLYRLMNFYLVHDGQWNPGILQTQTLWRKYPIPRGRTLCQLSHTQSPRNWRVWTIFRRFQYYEDIISETGESPLDPDKPHVMAFLADGALIREDVLSTSELTCITYLVADGALKYKHHRFIPATLMSASLRTVRIVQGVLDCQKGTLEIRKSQPVTFSDSRIANWDKWLTLLGWMIGNPADGLKSSDNPLILHLGSGESVTPVELASRSYKRQLCMDFSPTVVDLMNQRHAEVKGIEWKLMDVRDMVGVADKSVGVAFDKGTLDAMIHGSPWNPPETVKENTSGYLYEIYPVLKDGGVFLYFTFRQPHFMKPLLNPRSVWDMDIQVLNDSGPFDYYGYMLHKEGKR
ncbi:lysine methyltransferase 4 [Metarhizium brunneum]|uniref:Lysine methyltransferase 4 n=1 Tax=Metarhizium brunneum TaxID=500148 RepID=A0A7D5YN20_9HYPO|nr:lysine methyltransferase 4 [Metarhizium brunneum]